MKLLEWYGVDKNMYTRKERNIRSLCFLTMLYTFIKSNNKSPCLLFNPYFWNEFQLQLSQVGKGALITVRVLEIKPTFTSTTFRPFNFN